MQIQIAPFIFKTASSSLFKDTQVAFPHFHKTEKTLHAILNQNKITSENVRENHSFIWHNRIKRSDHGSQNYPLLRSSLIICSLVVLSQFV